MGRAAVQRPAPSPSICIKPLHPPPDRRNPPGGLPPAHTGCGHLPREGVHSEVVDAEQLALQELICAVHADSCGVNTPTMATFQLSTCCDPMQSWEEMCPILQYFHHRDTADKNNLECIDNRRMIREALFLLLPLVLI